MEGINKIFCGTEVKNTGKCECFFDPKLLDGAFIVPKGRIYSHEELLDANIQLTLETDIMAAKNARIFPIGPFEAITDGTEDPIKQTFGYGTIRTVREGKYVWAFQFLEGGLNQSNALRSFNYLTSKFAIIFRESQNNFIGTSKKITSGVAAGQWGLAGIPMNEIYTRPWKASDGTNVTGYMIEFNFDPIYVNEKIAFKKVSIDALLLSELNGLEDIVLKVIGDLADGASAGTFGGDTDCGSTDLYTLFKDELAQATAWVIKDSAGAAKSIATVVANDASKGWVITLTGPAVFEDGDTVELAAPSVLAAAPISVPGYESDILTLDLGS